MKYIKFISVERISDIVPDYLIESKPKGLEIICEIEQHASGLIKQIQIV